MAPRAAIVLSAPEGMTVEAALDGGLLVPAPPALRAPARGDHWLATVTRDGAGRRSEMRWTRLRVDRDPPVLTLTIEPPPVARDDGRRVARPGAVVTLTATDALAGVAQTGLDDGLHAVVRAEGSARLTLRASGACRVVATARDRVGNVAEERIELLVEEPEPVPADPPAATLARGPRDPDAGDPGQPEPEPSAPAEGVSDRVGWYVVKDGDTLEDISERFLGAKTLWPENWKLNPQLVDPHRLRIGQRLRIILERRLPARSAEVRQVERRVEKKPYPQEWAPASAGDLLREKDGLRTFPRSSAELAFDDGSHLVLSEESLVFLMRSERTVTGQKHDAIEVLEGQADLEARTPRARSSDIEIVFGGATSRPEAGPDGRLQTRTRQAKGGDGQLMVYGGKSVVAKAGAAVTVPKGMGTSVPEKGPPRPAEKLLDAPALLEPAAGAEWDLASPRFAWRAVAGAASYTLEVCRDAGCAQLVERRAGIPGPSLSTLRLAKAAYLWRVTAVAASGLDGYPSDARALVIRNDADDEEPPALALVRDGAGEVVSPRRVALGPGASLHLEARDDASGVAEVTVRWNEDPPARFQGGALRPPAGPGLHRLVVVARDGAGHRSQPLRVEVETAPDPTPPRVDAR